MSGWKTWTGGIGLILTGLALIAKDLNDGNFTHISEAIAAISAGVGMIGIGHKVEKAA